MATHPTPAPAPASPSPGAEKREAAATTIRVGADVVTLVNVFTVAPERQQALVDLLVEATERTMRRLPGFVSANIHRSYDGHRVVNYAQWRTRADFDAMLRHPDARPHMEAAAAMAAFQPTLCEVAAVHHAGGA